MEILDGELCPECGDDSLVLNKRYYTKIDRVGRTRECVNCGHRWKTVEITVEDLKKLTRGQT